MDVPRQEALNRNWAALLKANHDFTPADPFSCVLWQCQCPIEQFSHYGMADS
jgi:hypothetical protein